MVAKRVIEFDMRIAFIVYLKYGVPKPSPTLGPRLSWDSGDKR